MTSSTSAMTTMLAPVPRSLGCLTLLSDRLLNLSTFSLASSLIASLSGLLKSSTLVFLNSRICDKKTLISRTLNRDPTCNIPIGCPKS
ncbi:hypothetical protein DdX_17523 [Ditylenchus destructor]|uniref:Uncharacterized protein n=1 Tax=Ditylenchus destructor TaxID=166010 RepID=A0AAD4MM16_9BILA|nr:hypothetical protein DdX_17523 [Ditylenchus destructor]